MGRSPCCEKAHTNKGAWTKEEDQRLINYIKSHGEGCWRSLPKSAGLLRCGKSCRLRWINYLRPDLKRGNFTEEEDEIIIKLHSLLGNKWSLIAGRLPGRTDNEIKNYWNTHIKRKLINRGIDPNSHKPIKNNNHNVSTTTNISSNYSVYDRDHANIITPIVKAEAEEANSSTSTGTTTEELLLQRDHHVKNYNERKQELNFPDLNLDLSISLPVQECESKKQDHHHQEDKKGLFYQVFDKSSVVTPIATQTVCLCYQLGFQRREACGCKNMIMNNTTTMTNNGFNWYIRPLDS
ncbi:hypothetical protein MKW92_024565 [Papaver armeniacum]|nr:hypothetical protein MKW92_024565 [Papaver armeniacum]